MHRSQHGVRRKVLSGPPRSLRNLIVGRAAVHPRVGHRSFAPKIVERARPRWAAGRSRRGDSRSKKVRLPTFHRPLVQSSPARDCLCLPTLFPGRQAFEVWKKAMRRPRTAIQVIVAFVMRQVFSTGPDLWGSFGRAPELGTPASSMHPGRACTLVRPSQRPPFPRIPRDLVRLARVHPTCSPTCRRCCASRS